MVFSHSFITFVATAFLAFTSTIAAPSLAARDAQVDVYTQTFNNLTCATQSTKGDYITFTLVNTIAG